MQITIQGIGTQKCDTIELDIDAIDQAATWCGSYDVLEMGQHFDAYVLSPRTPLLPTITGLPLMRRFTSVPGKRASPSVQGNIGEAVAALTAVTSLGFAQQGVAHVKAGPGAGGYKSPDLLLEVTDDFRKLMDGLYEAELPLPNWIPCEAKCRGSAREMERAITDGLKQLQSFWRDLLPVERGFGLVVCFVYQPWQSINVRLFVPDQVLESHRERLMKAIIANVDE